MSLHKLPVVIFPNDDIEERTSRWVEKCVKKFNPYARYNVEHWKNLHAKIFYIKKQKEPGMPKEVVYSNSKIVQLIKTYWELGHEHKFITDIVDDYAETGLLWLLSVFIRSTVIWERVHDFQLGVESYQQKSPLIRYLTPRDITREGFYYPKLCGGSSGEYCVDMASSMAPQGFEVRVDLDMLRYGFGSTNLYDILSFLQLMAHRHTARSAIGLLVFTITSYFIWLEHNNRRFKKVRRSSYEMYDIITVTVRLKLLTIRFMNTVMGLFGHFSYVEDPRREFQLRVVLFFLRQDSPSGYDYIFPDFRGRYALELYLLRLNIL
ncbi:hypothetical protein Tco_0874951 [Tanacetum coccineum]|uniref:Uncharacterized protein n=1 Tax=Tanacetum coccineum TaxID=301880 RepID=A0ABQ5BN34_9ASTR